jgi:hypothetical protein
MWGYDGLASSVGPPSISHRSNQLTDANRLYLQSHNFDKTMARSLMVNLSFLQFGNLGLVAQVCLDFSLVAWVLVIYQRYGDANYACLSHTV